MTFQDLRQLRTILNESLDTLEDIYRAQSLDFPSLDDSYSSSPADFLAKNNPQAKGCIRTSVAAAYQILSMLRNPFAILEDAANAVCTSFDTTSRTVDSTGYSTIFLLAFV